MIRMSFLRVSAFAFVAALLASSSLSAGEPASRRTTLTIYRDGSALVGDTRPLSLKPGEQDVQWPDIPATVDASSVHLSAPDGATRILTQTYRYDFAEAGRALELARGSRVVCTTEDGKRVEGTLWAMDGGTLTLATDAGLLMLQQQHLMSVETPLPSRPLTTRPTLAWRLWSAKGSSSDVTATYLASGLSWTAEYVLVVDDDDRRGTLSGAASIVNGTGSDFRDASVRLVAGSPHRVSGPPEPRMKVAMLSGVRAGVRESDGAPEMATEQSVDDYHLYTLTRRVSVGDKETQRIALFDDASVKPRRTYRFTPGHYVGGPRGSYGGEGIYTELALTNDEKSGLGMPLPGGRVRVYTAADGGEVLLGEDQSGHVARGDTLRVIVGSPFDLNATREMTDEKRISDREQEQSWRTTFRNRRKDDVTIVWDEALPGRNWRILESSQPYAKKDASTIAFTVRVPAGKEVPVSYTMRWSY